MNSQSARQIGDCQKNDPQFETTTHLSETTINMKIRRQASPTGSQHFFKYEKAGTKKDDQFLYRLKMKVLGIYRLVSEEANTATDITNRQIEQLLFILGKNIKKKFHEMQKVVNQYQQDTKVLEIDKINLQTQIDAYSVDLMRLKSQNSKNMKIIACDRQKYARNIASKDTECDQLRAKIFKLETLLKEQQKIIEQSSKKRQAQKSDLDNLKQQLFKNEKKFLIKISQQKAINSQLAQEIQAIKQSLMRTCQQKKELMETNEKLSINLHNERNRNEKLSHSRHQLEIKYERIVQKIENINNINSDLMKKLEDEGLQRQGLQVKLCEAIEHGQKFKALENAIEKIGNQIKQALLKIGQLIRMYEIQQLKLIETVESCVNTCKTLEQQYRKQNQLLAEELRICQEISKIGKWEEMYDVQSEQVYY